MTSLSLILDNIIKLEKELHSEKTRKDLSRLEILISDDFIEFGTSGKIYSKKDIILRLPNSEYVKIDSFDFSPRYLSDEIVQIIYKTKICHDEESTRALRSSLWKKSLKQWQMIFHQSTKF